MWQGIMALCLTVTMGLSILACAQQPEEVGPKYEDPIVAQWKSEGLIQSAEVVEVKMSIGSQDYTVLELRATVSHGTLDDENSSGELLERLQSDIMVDEHIYMLVVVLIEEPNGERPYRYRGYAVTGREHLMDELWKEWSEFRSRFGWQW